VKIVEFPQQVSILGISFGNALGMNTILSQNSGEGSSHPGLLAEPENIFAVA